MIGSNMQGAGVCSVTWLVLVKNEWRNRSVLIQYRPARNDDEIIAKMNSESGTKSKIQSQKKTLNLNVKWKVITAWVLGYAVVFAIAVVYQVVIAFALCP